MYPGGILKTGITVDRGGVICAVSFRGDFMSRRDTAEIEAALCGCPYLRDAMRAVLENFTLEDYFGTISREEILDSLI